MPPTTPTYIAINLSFIANALTPHQIVETTDCLLQQDPRDTPISVSSVQLFSPSHPEHTYTLQLTPAYSVYAEHPQPPIHFNNNGPAELLVPTGHPLFALLPHIPTDPELITQRWLTRQLAPSVEKALQVQLPSAIYKECSSTTPPIPLYHNHTLTLAQTLSVLQSHVSTYWLPTTLLQQWTIPFELEVYQRWPSANSGDFPSRLDIKLGYTTPENASGHSWRIGSTLSVTPSNILNVFLSDATTGIYDHLLLSHVAPMLGPNWTVLTANRYDDEPTSYTEVFTTPSPLQHTVPFDTRTLNEYHLRYNADPQDSCTLETAADQYTISLLDLVSNFHYNPTPTLRPDLTQALLSIELQVNALALSC